MDPAVWLIRLLLAPQYSYVGCGNDHWNGTVGIGTPARDDRWPHLGSDTSDPAAIAQRRR